MSAVFNNPLLSSAYLPPAEYFFVLANSNGATIEYCETFQKQSYRNRCNIYATDGPFTLHVPVCHSERRLAPISETRIDYSRNWVHQHEIALISAYRSSPFFEYYWDGFKAILHSKPELLVDLNTQLTKKLLEEFNIGCELRYSSEYLKNPEGPDLRNTIHPKNKEDNLMKKNGAEKPYYQVFSARFGFISNLSAIDLLFNEGPQACDYLTF
ncbi:MAG: WbqC family protein [Bacteroidales bacterium]|nr:WbqC family protein [Bacteroidales bacterium]